MNKYLFIGIVAIFLIFVICLTVLVLMMFNKPGEVSIGGGDSNSKSAKQEEIKINKIKLKFPSDWKSVGGVKTGIENMPGLDATCVEVDSTRIRTLELEDTTFEADLCSYAKVKDESRNLEVIVSDTDKHLCAGGCETVSTVIEKTDLKNGKNTGTFNFVWQATFRTDIDITKVANPFQDEYLQKLTDVNGNPMIYYVNGCIKTGVCFYWQPKMNEGNVENIEAFKKLVEEIEID